MCDTSRIISSLFLSVSLFTLNGCMTNNAINHAQGISSRSFPSGTGEDIDYHMHFQPHPAYYGLVPLTIPADVVTSPFQLGYYLLHKHGQPPDSINDSQ